MTRSGRPARVPGAALPRGLPAAAPVGVPGRAAAGPSLPPGRGARSGKRLGNAGRVGNKKKHEERERAAQPMRCAKAYSLLFPPPPQKKISLESGSRSCVIGAMGRGFSPPFSSLSLFFFSFFFYFRTVVGAFPPPLPTAGRGAPPPAAPLPPSQRDAAGRAAAGLPRPGPARPPYLSFPPQRSRGRSAPGTAPGQRPCGARRRRGGCGRSCCGTAAPSAGWGGSDGTDARRFRRGRSSARLCSPPAAAISSSPPLRAGRLRAACWRAAVEDCAHTCVPRCGRAAAFLLLLLFPALLLLQAAAGGQGLAELPEPAAGRDATGCALRPAAERRGSLWGRRGGGGWGGSKEKRGGGTGGAFSAQVGKGRARHLSWDIG